MREEQKKEKEARKKLLQKQRKLLTETCKACEYFSCAEEEKLRNLESADRLGKQLSLEELENFNLDMQKAENKSAVFENAVRG